MDKVAMVTGAGSGLGEATARRLVQEGYRVILVDLNEEGLAGLARNMGDRVIPCTADVCNEADVTEALAQFPDYSLEVVVQCAGIAPAKTIAGRKGPMPLEDFSRVIQINLIGTFNVMRLAAQRMIANTPDEDGARGVVINTASIAAQDGQIGQAAYASSKGGVASLTLPAAREFARHGIRVMAIAPGLMGTPMLLSMPEDVQDGLKADLPFPKRFGYPEEYASLVMEIVRNPMFNGEMIRLDGALRMG